MTVREFKLSALEQLKNLYPEREINNITRILLEDVAEISSISQSMNPELEVTDKETVLLKAVSRLQQHEPLQYVTGMADFCGLKLQVNRDVLIPRPETEELVELVTSAYKTDDDLRILDIGTGSGCIAIALKKHFKRAEVVAVDVSKPALETAKKNARNCGVEIEFIEYDFLNRYPDKDLGIFDLIISNPPYITHAEFDNLEPNVQKFEPAIALTPEDGDALIFYRRIAEFAEHHLDKKGAIYLEMNAAKSAETATIFRGWPIQIKKDLQGLNRMLISGRNDL